MKNRIVNYLKSKKQLHLLLILALKVKHIRLRAIQGKNNTISNHANSKNLKYDIIGNNIVEIMKGVTLSNVLIYIRGNNHLLKIGENVTMSGGSIWFEDSNCKIIVGKNTSIESAHFAANEVNSTISIGEDCMFSYGIELRTGDSHSIIDKDTKCRINHAKDIFVEDHVWIGAKSILLKGVTIGKSSIIGIGSIVTKNIASFSIAAGVPARVIKSNVDWCRERLID